jgi:FeS assembly protein IscX
MYTWTDHLEVGRILAQMYPDDDPWTMSFQDLKARTLTVPEFNGNEDDDIEDYELEGIQSAWGWGKE